jgi:hypothetical protein
MAGRGHESGPPSSGRAGWWNGATITPLLDPPLFPRMNPYPRTGIAVAFIISELPGERAEALFIAMAASVPTAGDIALKSLRVQLLASAQCSAMTPLKC